jgi:hypothetical protein
LDAQALIAEAEAALTLLLGAHADVPGDALDGGFGRLRLRSCSRHMGPDFPRGAVYENRARATTVLLSNGRIICENTKAPSATCPALSKILESRAS